MNLGDIILISGLAGCASVIGGLLTSIRKPDRATIAAALGFAGGALLAAIAFELMAEALERAPLWLVAGGAAFGLFFMFGLDVVLRRWPPAMTIHTLPPVPRLHRRLGGREDRSKLLAVGTAIEEIVEGAAIALGATGDLRLGLVIAITIAFDNFAEGLAIGAVIQARSRSRRKAAGRIMGWTILIGGAVVVSSVTTWLFLPSASSAVVAALLAFVGGGLLYLTITQIIPEAEVAKHERTVGISAGLGFIAVLVLSSIA